MVRPVLCSLFLLVAGGPLAAGRTFLGEGHGGIDALRLSRDLRRAMDEVMGCGADGIDAGRLAAIETAILPMWQTLPRTSLDRVDWKTLRYAAHRYFMQQSSLVVRGFEPSLLVNASTTGAAEILSKQVPAHVDLLLGQGHASAGFSLEDSATFIGALEQLIYDSETKLLEKAYHDQSALTRWTSSQDKLQEILEIYIARWMIGEDEETVAEVLQDRSLLADIIPNWEELQGFVEGRIRTLAFARTRSPQAGQGLSLLHGDYSFDDAHEVAGSLTRTFQSFWQSECEAMKEQLVSKDKDGTGRVGIADFYGDGSVEEWHFGESFAYLGDLGVLDMSSPSRGAEVLIPNYLQAASNCIMAGPHYLVCCQNECESILGEIEANISAPTATPKEILAIVTPLRAEAEVPQGGSSRHNTLIAQLDRVAAVHGGKVPLHSRLFAQWLHYYFPRECPFPHKAGEFAGHTLTTGVYGIDKAIATGQEMELIGKQAKVAKAKAKAKARTKGNAPQDTESWREASLMTQWSEDEELFADYASMSKPKELRDNTVFHSALLSAVGVALAVAACVSKARPEPAEVKALHKV